MIELLMTAQGLVRALYTEMIPIQALGPVEIRRASHVEPDAAGQWWADLSLSGGPQLGPFPHRSAALQAEHDWLTQHVLFGPTLHPLQEERRPDEDSTSCEVPATSIASANGAFQTPISCLDLP